jgi:hypothetical protein
LLQDPIEKVLWLGLGWLLGILSPVIVEAIKRRRENRLGRQAIVAELSELGSVLATAAYGALRNQGKADRAFLEWLKADLERYATAPELQAFIPNLRAQLSWSDADSQRVAAAIAHEQVGRGTVLQKYPVPLLDARVSALWSFDTMFQRDLLSIRRSLSLLDDLVDRSRQYHDLTFGKLDEHMAKRAVENHEQACLFYAERAQKTVKLIRDFISRCR